jgi:hypothetical protein
MIRMNLTQRVALAGQLAVSSAPRAAGSYQSDSVDTTLLHRLSAECAIGTLAGSGTVNFRFQQNSVSVSSDSGWADINSTSCITSTFTSAANNSAARLELRLDQNPTVKKYVRALATVATSSWTGNIQLLAEPASYEPTSDRNQNVAQTVVF